MYAYTLQARLAWSGFVPDLRFLRRMVVETKQARLAPAVIAPMRSAHSAPSAAVGGPQAWASYRIFLVAAFTVSLLSALPSAAVAATDTSADCLFNWAESNYAAYFVPRGTSSLISAPYYFRYYSQTNTYLGTSSDTNHLYYMGPMSANAILDLGAASTWYATSGCSGSDLQQAKNMFGELRTTFNSFANDGKTGFLDTQVQTMRTDLEANVGSDMKKVDDRIGAMDKAVGMFEDARAYSSSNTLGLRVGTHYLSSGSTLIRTSGSALNVWNGFGSYDFCWTDSATGVTSKVTCARAARDAANRIGNYISMVVVELTAGGAANQYSYTATRYNLAVTPSATGVTFGALSLARNALLSTSTTPVYLPVGSGTVAKTVVNNQITNLALNGTMPPSALTCVSPTATSLLAYSSLCPTGQIVIPASGVDTLTVSAARTALGTANNYHYVLSGSVSTASASDPTKVATLSFDDGSYIDMDETDPNNGKAVTARLVGTAQTAATKFTGTLTASSFQKHATGTEYQPTSIVFDGSISDTPAGSASPVPFMTGRLVASVVDYNKYYPNGIPATGAVAGATNYIKGTVTFTGTIQAPSRPPLQLVLSVTKTGLDTGTTTLNYTYDNVVISGSGSFDDRVNTSTLTLTNQDGIQTVIRSTGGKSTGTVTKSGATLATVANNTINYVDGYSESLN